MQIATLACAVLALPALALPSPAADAQQLLKRVQERHAAGGGLTAAFTQTYRSGVLGQRVVERGTVSIRRPGRMRWEYREPEEKLFVSDGQKYWFYVPADRQVIIRQQAGDTGLAALLLSGRGDVLDHFQASLEPRADKGRHRLRLMPKQGDQDVQEALLEVDDAGRVHAVTIVDSQGSQSHFRFDSLREDVQLADKLFRFDVPSGVEVVTE